MSQDYLKNYWSGHKYLSAREQKELNREIADWPWKSKLKSGGGFRNQKEIPAAKQPQAQLEPAAQQPQTQPRQWRSESEASEKKSSPDLKAMFVLSAPPKKSQKCVVKNKFLPTQRRG